MKLKPAHKEKRRYIFLRFDTQKKLGAREAAQIIESAYLEFFGQLGFAQANPMFLTELWHFPYGVVRIGHKYPHNFKCAMLFAKNFKGENIRICCLSVSGSLKKIKAMLKEGKNADFTATSNGL